ncbi:MAG: MFS transporter [Candidatus Nezhaarchaeota archaeon]|nr:MFS transporter [Candidatus Nezhaarchaeota archaeon]MCX8142095.1 MFS transporter [Candidatus Nezhaarchaeota archaeon]MDW8050124.1 MFS transporter [Nitrososphaerota archaeon]
MRGGIGVLILLIGYVMITFASQSIWVTFSPVVTNVALELQVSKELVGYLAVLYPLFFLILTIPSGLLLDRNFRLWLTFGAFTTFLGGFNRLFMPHSYPWLLTCQLLSAIGQPFLLNGFVPFATRIYEERRALIVSILSLSMYLGTISALATGYILYTSGGILMLILPTSIISILGMLIFAFGIQSIKEIKHQATFKFQFKDVINKKDLWLIGCILGLGIATFDNLATWLQPALETIGLGYIAGDAVALAIISGLIGVTFIPSVVAKANLRTLYIRGIAPLITIFYLTLSAYHDVIMVLLLLTSSGFLMLPAYPIIMDWIGKFHKKEVQGSATGFVGLVSRVISVILLFVAPSFIHGADVFFYFLTAIVASAFIFALLMPNDRKVLRE